MSDRIVLSFREKSESRKQKEFLIAGVLFAHVPPLSIPNREVKACATDDTYRESGGESRLCQQLRTFSHTIRHQRAVFFICHYYEKSRHYKRRDFSITSTCYRL